MGKPELIDTLLANGNSVYKAGLKLFICEHHSADTSMAEVHSYAVLGEECIVKYQFGWDKKKSAAT